MKLAPRNPLPRTRRHNASFTGIFASLALLLGLGEGFPGQAAENPGYASTTVRPPQIAREYRAAWVATVANIDWPSTNRLSTAQQKTELLAILDKAAALKLNTVIFQVRPGCDAMYASPIEPWSEYLNGAMGFGPTPPYDPLAFAVEEAHRRGLELHAWFNPYRARHASAKSPVSANHISKTRPQLVRQYGRYLWLDPGEKEVQDYSLSVVMDVVNRYDVDGVHFDDYFYPYHERGPGGRDLDFPDEPSWERFGKASGLSRDDWRRENVNVFIERVYRSVKSSKPWVKFGISPFGIWRPGHPAQIKGYDAYDKLYADSRKWLVNGWLDYFAPQLYWAISPPDQSFPVLLDWWTEQNRKRRHVVPGMDSTKTRGAWKPEEIVNQIRITRKEAGVKGHIHWNMKSLMRNSGLDSTLQREVYSQPALVPACTWLDRTAPPRPRVTVSGGERDLKLTWTAADAQPIALWVLQARNQKRWKTTVLPANTTSMKFDTLPDAVAVCAVDRFGNASAPAGVARSGSPLAAQAQK